MGRPKGSRNRVKREPSMRVEVSLRPDEVTTLRATRGDRHMHLAAVIRWLILQQRARMILDEMAPADSPRGVESEPRKGTIE